MKFAVRSRRSGTLCPVIALMLLVQLPAHGDGAGRRTQAPDPLEGIWRVMVTLTNCATGEPLPIPNATFEAMSAFVGDGTFHDTNANDPTLRSMPLGYWERTEPHQYRFAFRFFRFDSTGLGIGSSIVRHDVALSSDGSSYTSSGTAEFYDVNGIRMLPDGCSRSAATRFE